MDANWFNAFFYDHYENVMNNVGRYVFDGFAGTSSGSGFGGSFDAGYGNNNNEVPTTTKINRMMMTVAIYFGIKSVITLN
jgi:hypothetical protein